MRTYKYSFLRCCLCKNKIFPVKLGQLKCSFCFQDYQVINGIPAMLEQGQTKSASQIFYENFIKIINSRNFDHYIGRRMEKMKKNTRLLQLSAFDKVLEVGPGEGNILTILRQKIKSEIIGLDYSMAFCQAIKKRFGDKIKIVNGDACYLPFKSDYFNFVLANAVLHHIDRKKQKNAVLELIRVCMSGGELVFIEPNRFHPLQLAYGILSVAERGILNFKVNKIANWLKSNKKVQSVKLLPLNTFIYTYRKFPPQYLFSFIRKIEPFFDHKFITTHYMIVAKLRK